MKAVISEAPGDPWGVGRARVFMPAAAGLAGNRPVELPPTAGSLRVVLATGCAVVLLAGALTEVVEAGVLVLRAMGVGDTGCGVCCCAGAGCGGRGLWGSGVACGAGGCDNLRGVTVTTGS